MAKKRTEGPLKKVFIEEPLKKSLAEEPLKKVSIRITINDSDCDKAMIKMLKGSSSFTIVSETDSELVVCPLRPRETFESIAPEVKLLNISPQKNIRKTIVSFLKPNPKRKKRDFGKIISISGVLLNK